MQAIHLLDAQSDRTAYYTRYSVHDEHDAEKRHLLVSPVQRAHE